MTHITSKHHYKAKRTSFDTHVGVLFSEVNNVLDIVLFCFVLIAGGCPYPNMDGRRIAARLQEGYRMPKPSHVDDQL